MPKPPKTKIFMPEYPAPPKQKETKKVFSVAQSNQIEDQIQGLQDAVRRLSQEVSQAVDLMGNLRVTVEQERSRSMSIVNEIDKINSHIRNQKQ